MACSESIEAIRLEKRPYTTVFQEMHKMEQITHSFLRP